VRCARHYYLFISSHPPTPLSEHASRGVNRGGG
jgi:hypothetical protein